MSTANQLNVEASRQFSAPVDKVFQAWTNGDQLKQWWKPMGNQLDEVVNELKPGGTVKYVFSGNTLVISGQYSEVSENKKLAYTWNWQFQEDEVKNGSYELAVEFTPEGNGSRLHVTQNNLENEESLQVHQQGWEKGLDDLKAFVEGSASGASPEPVNEEYAPANEAPEDSTGGYRELPEQEKVGGG